VQEKIRVYLGRTWQVFLFLFCCTLLLKMFRFLCFTTSASFRKFLHRGRANNRVWLGKSCKSANWRLSQQITTAILLLRHLEMMDMLLSSPAFFETREFDHPNRVWPKAFRFISKRSVQYEWLCWPDISGQSVSKHVGLDLKLHWSAGNPIKFYTGRLRPEVQTLPL